IVCDNSSSREARREIEAVCRDSGTHYIALPFNPERHPCRSHGLALNWAFYNLARTLGARVCAFVDHDLFALAPLDLAAKLAGQPFYGRLRSSRWGWYLWPGYCAFDVEAVAGYAPDFNTDIPRQLDTGGRNFVQVFHRF